MRAHVLLVDDEDGPREALQFALARKNKWWKITTAASVDEARRILEAPPGESGAIDVVLTDLVMGRDHPEGGIEVLELAKKKDPFIMVILFTAHDKMIDSEEAYKEGAFDCIEKNILGTVAAKEISTKANAAIHFRNMLLSRLRHQEQFVTLRRFFDPKTLRAILDRPSFLDLKLRPATIVFWRLGGFTELCSALESRPAKIKSFLADYYKAATAVTFRHHGILDKFMGETVMALFCGFGPAGTDFAARGAEHAADAALMLREVSAEFLRKWQAEWSALAGRELPISLAAALHTGHSLIGNLGIEIHRQFTALGPHVTLATDLRRQVRGGQILLSQATAGMLGEGYDIAPVEGARDVDGRGAYELRAKVTRAASTGGPPPS